MRKNILFDHTFTEDQGHSFWKRLSKLGFKVEERPIKHPKVECRFIYFESNSYLEFIHAPNSKSQERAPGISFRVETKLKSLYRSYQKQGINCSFIHRNYNWFENSSDHLLGWNFLDFCPLGFKTFYPWFTEYEQEKDKGQKKIKQKHPNGVTGIVGHEFVLNPSGRKFFSQILRHEINEKITLHDGTIFYFREGRTNYHSKVILKTKNLQKTLTFLKDKKTFLFQDKESILLKNPSKNKRMWDLVISS